LASERRLGFGKVGIKPDLFEILREIEILNPPAVAIFWSHWKANLSE